MVSRRLFLFFLLVSLPWPARPAAYAYNESQLHAVFCLRTAQYAQWPEPVRTNLVIGVWRNPRVARILMEISASKVVQNRPVVVREPADVEAALDCDLLLVDGDPRELLKAVGRRPILTIGSSEHFLDEGGIIQIERAGDRMAFSVNLETALQCKLKLGSQFLKLARKVRKKNEKRTTLNDQIGGVP